MEIEYNEKMINRLKRAEGQMRGIQKMMEGEQGCTDVITQLSAVRSSIDKLMGLIVAENLKACVMSEDPERDENIEKAIHLIVKK